MRSCGGGRARAVWRPGAESGEGPWRRGLWAVRPAPSRCGRGGRRDCAIFPSHSCTILTSTAGVNDMRPLRAQRWLEGRTPRWRRALVVGCALVLIGLAMAVTPAAPLSAGEAVATHASPWAAAAAEARILADRVLQRESDDLLPARISHQGHGLRGAVRPTGKERRAARCGASGKRIDAACRPESVALRVAPRRPPAASRASTVFPDTLFGPLLADRTPGHDAGRDPGEKP